MGVPYLGLALASTHEGDRPLVLPPLGGTSSDNASRLATIQAIEEQ